MARYAISCCECLQSSFNLHGTGMYHKNAHYFARLKWAVLWLWSKCQRFFSRKPSPQECDRGILSKSIWKPRERGRRRGVKRVGMLPRVKNQMAIAKQREAKAEKEEEDRRRSTSELTSPPVWSLTPHEQVHLWPYRPVCECVKGLSLQSSPFLSVSTNQTFTMLELSQFFLTSSVSCLFFLPPGSLVLTED